MCACEAGAENNGIASYVAREMNMRVMAPTTHVWIGIPGANGTSEMELFEDDGRGRNNKDRPGCWRVFNPDGSIEELEG